MAQSNKQTNQTLNLFPENIALWKLILSPFIIILACFAVYISSLHYAFQFDDLPNILKFYEIRHLTFKQLFFSSSRWICRWLNTVYYSFGKFDPFLFRFGNLIFHILCSILVFFIVFSVLRRLKEKNFLTTYAYSLAFTTSMLFALHPVHTQTVSYVVQGLSEGLAGLFMLLILAFFLLFCFQKNKIMRMLSLVGLFISALLSCGTKEIAIVSPLLVLLTDWFFVSQGSWKALKTRLFLHVLLFSAIFSTYLFFLKPQFFATILSLKAEAVNNIGNTLSINRHDKILPYHYLISQFKVILHYAFIFIWPFNISADYDWKLVHSFFDIDCFGPFLILCSLFFIILRRLRNNRTDLLSFCFIWFMVLILPRSSIIPSSELVADYKTYMASISILLLLSWIIVYTSALAISLARITLTNFQPAMLCVLIFPLGYATYTRNKVWSSGEAFWQDVIEHAPNKARAYNNKAVALCEKNKYEESIEYFKKAISLDKEYPDPWFNMAAAYNYLGDLDKAMSCAEQSIAIYPYMPEAYLNLGSFLIEKKEYEKAEAMLKKALSFRPYYGKAHYNLGRVYVGMGKKQEAYNSFKNACTAGDFDNALGFYSYGAACLELKKYDEAIQALTKAQELSPQGSEIALNLAHAYFFSKQYQTAVPIYQKLAQLHPEEPTIWFNLGECYAFLNYFKEAITCYTRAYNIRQIPLVLLRLAACFERLGRIQEARHALQELLALNPSEQLKREAYSALAQL